MRTKFEERCKFAAEAEAEEEQEERQGNNLGGEDGGTTSTQETQGHAAQSQERNGEGHRGTGADKGGGKERLLYVSVLDSVLAAIYYSTRFNTENKTAQHKEPSSHQTVALQNNALTVGPISQTDTLSQNKNR